MDFSAMHKVRAKMESIDPTYHEFLAKSSLVRSASNQRRRILTGKRGQVEGRVGLCYDDLRYIFRPMCYSSASVLNLLRLNRNKAKL